MRSINHTITGQDSRNAFRQLIILVNNLCGINAKSSIVTGSACCFTWRNSHGHLQPLVVSCSPGMPQPSFTVKLMSMLPLLRRSPCTGYVAPDQRATLHFKYRKITAVWYAKWKYRWRTGKHHHYKRHFFMSKGMNIWSRERKIWTFSKFFWVSSLQALLRCRWSSAFSGSDLYFWEHGFYEQFYHISFFSRACDRIVWRQCISPPKLTGEKSFSRNLIRHTKRETWVFRTGEGFMFWKGPLSLSNQGQYRTYIGSWDEDQPGTSYGGNMTIILNSESDRVIDYSAWILKRGTVAPESARSQVTMIALKVLSLAKQYLISHGEIILLKASRYVLIMWQTSTRNWAVQELILIL